MSLEHQYLNSLLERWGAWCELYGADSGLPSVNWIVNIGWHGVDQPKGDKILGRHPKDRRIWLTNHFVVRLPDVEREAITAWYAFRMKPKAGYWEPREKAELLKISYPALKARLHRGKRRLLPVLSQI